MAIGQYQPFKHFREGAAYHLAMDAELRQGYLDNVANFLLDHCGMKDRNERQEKAAHLLKLLFE